MPIPKDPRCNRARNREPHPPHWWDYNGHGCPGYSVSESRNPPKGGSGISSSAATVVNSSNTHTSTIDINAWKWLESTKRLQEDYYGRDFSRLQGDELADYIVLNHTALIQELSEALDEISWKTWTTKPRGEVNRDLFVKELVDAAHFLANMLCAVKVTDNEWQQAYMAKQQVNRNRMASKQYDGVSGKCPKCKRSYDDNPGCHDGFCMAWG